MPFAHAEVFKMASLANAEVKFPRFIKQINTLPLSADTCARPCDDMSDNVIKQLLRMLRVYSGWSIALDDSTDRSEVA